MPIRRIAYLLILLLTTSAAVAQDAPATSAPTQDYVDNMAKGAVDNRTSANQLYSMSRQHEHAAHHLHGSGAVDAVLLAEALSEGQQAFAADNQAQEMARAALSGIQSGTQQQSQFSSKSVVNVSELQEIASQPSPYAGLVASTFAGYGLSIGSDKTTLDAPSSGQNNNLISSSVANNLRAAGAGGPLPADLMSGLTTGVQPPPGESPGRNPAGTPRDKNALHSTDPKDSSTLASSAEAAWRKKVADDEDRFTHNRASVLKQLGRPAGQQNSDAALTGPIRFKSEDIFQVIHTHYKSLRDNGAFYEFHAPAISPGPPVDPPQFSRGI